MNNNKIISKNYPIKLSDDDIDHDCAMYRYIRGLFEYSRDTAFAPKDIPTLRNVGIDMSVQTLDDILNKLYGRHICTIKEMKEEAINYEEYIFMKKTHDLNNCSRPVYAAMTHKWAEFLLNAIPDPRRVQYVTTWQKAYQIGVLARYFDDKNFLNIPMEDTFEGVVAISYSGDYAAFAISILGSDEYNRLINLDQTAAVYDNIVDNEIDHIERLDLIAVEVSNLGLGLDEEIITNISKKDVEVLKRLVTKSRIIGGIRGMTVRDLKWSEKQTYLYCDFLGPCCARAKIRKIVVSRSAVGYNFSRNFKHVQRDDYTILHRHLYPMHGVFLEMQSHKFLYEKRNNLVSFEKIRPCLDNYFVKGRFKGDLMNLAIYGDRAYLIEREYTSVVELEFGFNQDIDSSYLIVRRRDNVLLILDIVYFAGFNMRHASLKDRMDKCLKISRLVRSLERYTLKWESYVPCDRFEYLSRFSCYKSIELCPNVVAFGNVNCKRFVWRQNGFGVRFRVVEIDKEIWLTARNTQGRFVPVAKGGEEFRFMLFNTYTTKCAKAELIGGKWCFASYRVGEEYVSASSISYYQDVVRYNNADGMARFKSMIMAYGHTI